MSSTEFERQNRVATPIGQASSLLRTNRRFALPATGTHRMTATEWAMLAGLSILWGGSFFFTHVALAALPPFTLVALRVGLAALALNLVPALSGTRLPHARTIWVAFLGIGLLNNAVPFSLIVWGQTQIASGLAAILNATTPLFTVAMALLTTADERMTGHRLAGVVIGFIGVAVMVARTRCQASAARSWRNSRCSAPPCRTVAPACSAGASGGWRFHP